MTKDDLISRQAAIDALDVLCQEHRNRIPGKRETYSEYNEAWQDALDRAEGLIFNLPPVQPEPQWISVTKRLPDNADHPGAFCPRYQVVTPYGVTEGWYRPHDHEKGGQWFALFWFMSQIYEIWNIDFERGDVPKVIGEAPVMEWRPLPEPYKPNK